MEAGLNEKAVGYWLQAGKNAAMRSANLEAIAHLQRGIEVVGRLPDGAARDRAELDFQFVLGPCLIATQGPASSKAVATFARARELCERLGEPPEYLQVMFWLATASVVRGELPQAARNDRYLARAAAEARGDRPALLNAMRGQAMILLFMGRIVDAREALERAVEMFNASDEADRMAARAAGQDAGVAELALMSWVLWLLGDVDDGGHANDRRPSARRRDRTSAYARIRLLLCVRSACSARRAGNCAGLCGALSRLIGGARIPSVARTVARDPGHLRGHARCFSRHARGGEGCTGGVSRRRLSARHHGASTCCCVRPCCSATNPRLRWR